MKIRYALAAAAILALAGAPALAQTAPMQPGMHPEEHGRPADRGGMGGRSGMQGGMQDRHREPGDGTMQDQPGMRDHGDMRDHGAMSGDRMDGMHHDEHGGRMDRHDMDRHDMGQHGMRGRGHGMMSRHARACQMRYRSYNPRTDRYMVGGGRSRRCML